MRSTEGNTSAKRRKSRVYIGTHQINKLETQHAGTYNIVICYGVGKRYSRLKLLWSETTLSLFGFVTRFILHIRLNNMTMTHMNIGISTGSD